jgi:uroporphyrinogen decarboxylase
VDKAADTLAAMNGRQLVIAAMEHRPVDRAPVFPVVTNYIGSRVLGRKVVDAVLDPMLTFEGIAAIIERFGFDGIEVGIGPGSDWQKQRKVVEIDGERFLANPTTGEPFARLQDDDQAVPVSSDPPIKHKSDLDKMGVTPARDYEKRGCLEPLREMVRRIGDEVFVAGVAASQTMNSLVAWRGSDQAMLDLIDDPEFVLAVMERATDISIELGKAAISAGVHGIYIGDAWASASIISPRQYERFCQPFHAKATKAFHELGVKVYLHICGNSAPILELMADTGVDAIEPLDQMDVEGLRDAKKRVGDRVCLKGGISTLALLNGSRDEVYELCVDAIRECGPTGYLLGSGDDIPRDTPFANIDAMRRAAEDVASSR